MTDTKLMAEEAVSFTVAKKNDPLGRSFSSVAARCTKKMLRMHVKPDKVPSGYFKTLNQKGTREKGHFPPDLSAVFRSLRSDFYL